MWSIEMCLGDENVDDIAARRVKGFHTKWHKMWISRTQRMISAHSEAPSYKIVHRQNTIKTNMPIIQHRRLSHTNAYPRVARTRIALRSHGLFELRKYEHCQKKYVL